MIVFSFTFIVSYTKFNNMSSVLTSEPFLFCSDTTYPSSESMSVNCLS